MSHEALSGHKCNLLLFLAARPGRSNGSSACWAAQVCSLMDFMSPIVNGVPQRVDIGAVIAHLQRRVYDAVNGSED